MSLLSKHIEQWASCTRCALHKVRKNVVLCRGKIPCQVLFIGEAPGLSENVIGVPFIGPAGHLLDKIIMKAETEAGISPAKAFINLVACIPLEGTRKLEEPTKQEIETCKPRVDEFILLSKPKVIVCVGKLSETQAKQHNWGNYAKCESINHPSFILRGGGQGLEIEADRVMLKLCSVFEGLK